MPGIDFHMFVLLTQDCFLTQPVLEPTKGGYLLDSPVSFPRELVENVKVHEPFGSSYNSQMQLIIKLKEGVYTKGNG